jgi:hypothetical protein
MCGRLPFGKGRPEGTHIADYVVEDHADRVLGTFKTQREAIDWAKLKGHSPLVARVRHLMIRKSPIIGAQLNGKTETALQITRRNV